MATTTENVRKLPGDLEFLTPQCPICAEHTDPEDGGYSCYRCGVAWDGHGENPERIDPDAAQCRSLYTLLHRCIHPDHVRAEYRCWMDAEHDGDHHNPESFYGWSTAEQTGEASA